MLTFGEETGLTTYAVDPGDMRTPMHQDAFPGEDISDRPLPETVVPRLLALLRAAPGTRSLPSPPTSPTGGGGLGMTTLTERSGVRFDAPDESTPHRHRPRSRQLPRRRTHARRPPGRICSTARFRDLADQLEPGDLVVVNNSATVNGEIDGVGAARPVVLHVASRLDDGTWVVELRTAPDASAPVLDAVAGETIGVGELPVTLLEPYPREGSSPTGSGNRLWRAPRRGRPAAAAGPARPADRLRLPRPPLPARGLPVGLQHRARQRGDGLGRPAVHRCRPDHRLVARGISVAPITLHTGVSSQEAGEGPQPEWFHVPATTARLVELTRAHGGRVVATGTTVTRALESAVVDGTVQESWGWTDRVVTPAHPPVVVNGLITGWHDAEASHLLLVEAVAGTELAQAAYDAAVAGGYRWHEFGDSGLFLP